MTQFKVTIDEYAVVTYLRRDDHPRSSSTDPTCSFSPGGGDTVIDISASQMGQKKVTYVRSLRDRPRLGCREMHRRRFPLVHPIASFTNQEVGTSRDSVQTYAEAGVSRKRHDPSRADGSKAEARRIVIHFMRS